MRPPNGNGHGHDSNAATYQAPSTSQRGETTWSTPPAPTRVLQAGEVAVSAKPTRPWSRARRWYVAEISEKTKVSLQIGGAVVVALFLIGAGRWWGTLDSERTTTQQTLSRHDQRITNLENAVNDLKDLVKDGRRVQDAAAKDSATAAANTTGIIYDLGELKVRLAERGINWPDRRGATP